MLRPAAKAPPPSDLDPDLGGKTRTLVLLAVAVLLAMALWFSASAVAPQLETAWSLSPGQAAWLTMSVQLGFVVGALVSASLNLADRIPAVRLVAWSAAAGALLNALIPLLAGATAGVGIVLALRFLTGMTLAGVYPPGMKLVASWCRGDRGLWIGLLVGALAVGSASPHLLAAVAGGPAGNAPWQVVLWAASGLALAGALIVALTVRQGPFLARAARFHWRHAAAGLADRPTRLANLGYFGHMWELYAVWTWLPLLLLARFEETGLGTSQGRLAGFAVIAAGGVGSVLAGRLADRWGRSRTTVLSLALSGSCALTVGFVLDAPGWLLALALVWGFAVVADSAQFSAAVSELADPRYVGTALTVQTSLGFLLTLVTIRGVPVVAEGFGWGVAFAVLALGPVVGGWAMLRLRGLPEAERMASGNR